MNKVILEKDRNQTRGDQRQKRNALIDNGPDRSETAIEDLYNFLEQRYRCSRDEAKEEFHRRIRK